MDSTHRTTPSAVTCIKHHARILHRRARAGDGGALQRLRALRELRSSSSDDIVRTVRRRQCLTASAIQLGFQSWEHALAVFEGTAEDFGSLLYPSSCCGHWNIWSAHYDEASAIRREHGGFLLAYRRQFLIVERDYIDSLGLDPEDPDWARIGRDIVRPGDHAARARLYDKLVHDALAEGA